MITDIYNSIAPFLPGLAFLTSLVSLYFAISSIRRTVKYQTFDYSPRLDLMSEIVQIVTNRDGHRYISSFGTGADSGDCPEFVKSIGFGYQALLQNQGQKVVQINRTSMVYGSEKVDRGTIEHIIGGMYNLTPGENRKLSFVINADEVDKFLKERNISECLFHLKVTCSDAKGKEQVYRRSLGGYGGGAIQFIKQSGESLINSD